LAMRAEESSYLSSGIQQQRTTNNNLGKDDFLKMLMAQLENQDPLDPMKDQQFISQMATFSSLEQMTNMNEKLEQFLSHVTANQWMDSATLIGKQVSWEKLSETEGGETTREVVEGLVQSVNFKNGAVTFEMEDGTVIEKDEILSVGRPEE
jgi:flagellar basal-body rod modification protein FlgD